MSMTRLYREKNFLVNDDFSSFITHPVGSSEYVYAVNPNTTLEKHIKCICFHVLLVETDVKLQGYSAVGS